MCFIFYSIITCCYLFILFFYNKVDDESLFQTQKSTHMSKLISVKWNKKKMWFVHSADLVSYLLRNICVQLKFLRGIFHSAQSWNINRDSEQHFPCKGIQQWEVFEEKLLKPFFCHFTKTNSPPEWFYKQEETSQSFYNGVLVVERVSVQQQTLIGTLWWRSEQLRSALSLHGDVGTSLLRWLSSLLVFPDTVRSPLFSVLLWRWVALIKLREQITFIYNFILVYI